MSTINTRVDTGNLSGDEQHDHEIRLVDTATPTSPTRPSVDRPSPTAEQASGRHSRESSAERRWSRGGLREELTRRKYAKYQQGRYTEDDGQDGGNGGGDDAPKRSGEASSSSGLKALDRGRALLRDKLRPKKPPKKPVQEEAVVDVLYENQRGLFLCGLPYYSSQSLLNFDPAAWTVGGTDYTESPVNITNAQVPDPTWAWAWPNWYADMGHDVDEEGWEYSFSFRQGFAWHGTHPWWHAWVRRRRWLRRRVKTRTGVGPHVLADSMTDAHQLNRDYFTIHSAPRETSRGSSAARGDNRSSFLSGGRAVTVDSDSEAEEEITDVAALMKGMKATTVDRKKLAAFRNFVEHGGDEVLYLPEMMKEFLGMFMYQNSRRLLLQTLEQAVEGLAEDPEKSVGGNGQQVSPAQRRQGLKKAIDAVQESISYLEYWSDIQVAERQLNSAENAEGNGEKALSSKEKPSVDLLKTKDINEEISSVRIQGIPSSAELDVEPGIMRPLGYMQENEENMQPPSTGEKGKQRA